MFKQIISIGLVVLFVLFQSKGNATSTLHSKKKKKSSGTVARTYKVSKYKRKFRRFKHGTGPDLKSITKDSPYYKDEPSNGVNAIETKQPEI